MLDIRGISEIIDELGNAINGCIDKKIESSKAIEDLPVSNPQVIQHKEYAKQLDGLKKTLIDSLNNFKKSNGITS